MREIQFILQCYSCKGETKCVSKIPSTPARGRKEGKKIQIKRDCERCGKPNLINVPETWDERGPVLGDKDDFLGYSEGIPILQGDQPE